MGLQADCQSSVLSSSTLPSAAYLDSDSPLLATTACDDRQPMTHSHDSSHLTSIRSGGIRKTPPHLRRRSASTLQQLHHLTSDNFGNSHLVNLLQSSSSQRQTLRASLLFAEPDTELDSSVRTWCAPTPPRSDAGLHSTSAADDQASVDFSESKVDSIYLLQHITPPEEMSSLGYLLPSQHTNGAGQRDFGGYEMDRRQSVSHSISPYSQASSSSPALYQGRIASQYGEQQSGNGAGPVYSPAGRRTIGPYDSPATSDYSVPSTHVIPPLNDMATSMPTSSIASPNMTGMQQQYGSNMPRHGSMYENTYYPQNYTTAPNVPAMYAPHQGAGYGQMPFQNNQISRANSNEVAGRPNDLRPKATCWEHGCNGRQFSTFSNLLRHQREKSGTAAKSYCPKCGAEFTRTTARNGHLLHDKCTKNRRASEER